MKGLALVRLLAVDFTPLRECRPFRWLWIGDVFATFGRQISNVAIPLQVYGLTGSSLMVGLVSLAQLVPLIAGSLMGGVVVDAFDRRKVILVTQVVLCALGVGYATNASLPNPQLWLIFLLAVLQAWVGGFDSPARRAALVNVVGVRMLHSALSVQQLVSNLGKLAGPALAGVIIAASGVQVAFWLYAVSILATLLAVAGLPSLRPEGGGRKAGWTSLVEGLAFVKDRRLIRGLMLCDISAMAFGLPRALFPAIGIEVLGGTAATVGLLYAAPGTGAFLGALSSGWLGRVQRQGRAVVICVACYGLAMAGFGLSPWLAATLVCLAVAGAADMYSAVLRNTLVQLGTPDQLRGRVASVNKAVVSGGPLVGDARAGAIATLTTPVFSVVSGGFATVAIIALLAWRYPDMRAAQIRDGQLVAGDAPPPGGSDGLPRGVGDSASTNI